MPAIPLATNRFQQRKDETHYLKAYPPFDEEYTRGDLEPLIVELPNELEGNDR